MAQKTFNVPDLGEVLVAKRRGTRNLRLSITATGQVRVGIPAWSPYSVGLAFAKSRAEWIRKHKPDKPTSLNDGDRVGKSFRLVFRLAKTLSTRIKDQQIIVYAPAGTSSRELESRVVSAAERALKMEASKLLPQRLAQLARQYGFDYRQLKIKKLTSRWGSCSSKKDITLSYYLIQLPWELIDYVIVHELAHTEHLNHGQNFWDRVVQCLPEAKSLRKQLKSYKPIIFPQS